MRTWISAPAFARTSLHGSDGGGGNDTAAGVARAQYSKGQARSTHTARFGGRLVLQQPSHFLEKSFHGKGFGEESHAGRQIAVPEDVAVGIA